MGKRSRGLGPLHGGYSNSESFQASLRPEKAKKGGYRRKRGGVKT